MEKNPECPTPVRSPPPPHLGGDLEDTPAWLEPLRRYVPLAVWIIVLATLLLIPLKVMQYGYLPGDDALRAAGKAVSGKTWQQVLVLDPVYRIDHEYGWSLLLSKIHTAFNADADGHRDFFGGLAFCAGRGWPWCPGCAIPRPGWPRWRCP